MPDQEAQIVFLETLQEIENRTGQGVLNLGDIFQRILTEGAEWRTLRDLNANPHQVVEALIRRGFVDSNQRGFVSLTTVGRHWIQLRRAQSTRTSPFRPDNTEGGAPPSE